MPDIDKAAYSKFKKANKANPTGNESYHSTWSSCHRDNDSEQTSKSPVFQFEKKKVFYIYKKY